MRMMTKCAARTAVKTPLLGGAEAHRNPPERSFAEEWFVVRPKAKNPASWKSVLGRDVGPKTKSLHRLPRREQFCNKRPRIQENTCKQFLPADGISYLMSTRKAKE